VKIFWEHSSFNLQDIYTKNTDVTITGNNTQIKQLKKLFDIMNKSVMSLRKDMGIFEATVSIPAIFLKRVVGQNNVNL